MSGTGPSFGFPLLGLHEAICRKGSISLKPLEAVSMLGKSMASSNGGLCGPKGAAKLLLGKLIQCKLASGHCSELSTAAEVCLARSYPGLSSSEEGPTSCSVFWEGMVSNWRRYSEHLAKWREKKQWLLSCNQPCCCFEWV